MLQVGVTGGIGSGKSTVCALFRCLEIPVFNADEAGRRLLAEDTNVIRQIENIFGRQIIINRKPDRGKMAEIVFNNLEKLVKLNSVIHPAVRKEFNKWAAEQNAPYVIDEAAILFETGFYKQLDYTVLVVAPEQLRSRRVLQRDGLDETAVKSRMKNQWKDKEKKKIANFVIINNDITPLLPQVMDIHNTIVSKVKLHLY